jgi:hypothetical protein
MAILTFERRGERPLSARQFRLRLYRHAVYSALLIGISLLIGTGGYHWLAHQRWIDAFLNAAMLLGGMGPVGSIDATAGKLFAALFALYAGLVFLVVGGLLIAPVFHRILHRFHFESTEGNAE